MDLVTGILLGLAAGLLLGHSWTQHSMRRKHAADLRYLFKSFHDHQAGRVVTFKPRRNAQ